MKKRWLIPIAGVTVALVTSATVTAFALTGDGSDTPVGESVGTQEPAFQDGGPGLISPPNPTITDDLNGSVSIVNDGPTVGGDRGTSVADDSGMPVPDAVHPLPRPITPAEGGDPISPPLPVDRGRDTPAKIGCDIGNGQGIAVGEPHPDTGGPLPLAPEPDGDVEPGEPIEEVLAPIDAVEIVVMESDPPQYGL